MLESKSDTLNKNAKNFVEKSLMPVRKMRDYFTRQYENKEINPQELKELSRSVVQDEALEIIENIISDEGLVGEVLPSTLDNSGKFLYSK